MLAPPEQRKTCARWIAGAVKAAIALIVLINGAFAEERIIAFDIPPQSLTTAIEGFNSATGQDLIYNSNLTSGRHSRGVRGLLTTEAALGILLEGTGLSVRRMDNRALGLRPVPATLEPSKSVITAQFYASLQSSLRGALCGNRDARPGRYRLAIRLWIDKAGRLTTYEQVGSAGSAEIDGAIRHAVSQLDVGVTPPADLEQPVVIVILPQAPGVTMACAEAAAQPTRSVR